MTTGYHRPRTAQRPAGPGTAMNAVIDLTETEGAENYELPGSQTPAEELAMEILAEQTDEFTCNSCFLVRHRSQLAREKSDLKYCSDCEG
ncbi:DUF4193 family protein [Arthrobacter sp. H35-D1]|nr:DUF4193 family protein [Arthrobacter sp. H35-D1]MDJ0313178.1 DUF4193 family protein [Arthrobacter sp. H35-D1]